MCLRLSSEINLDRLIFYIMNIYGLIESIIQTFKKVDKLNLPIYLHLYLFGTLDYLPRKNNNQFLNRWPSDQSEIRILKFAFIFEVNM